MGNSNKQEAMTTTEMNSVIADFMGYSNVHIADLSYHADFQLLMPVWFKIQGIGADMGYAFKSYHEDFHAGIDHQSIERCYHVVVDFIIEYKKKEK